jgi:GntR family negative regulator for fad regulon and positive regulator of fabA
MNNWNPLPKPAEIAETRLLEAILDGTFPIDSSLPGERDLAVKIGVTRPTLREALQRLARDGWFDIQHGKPTRVRDYWREGSLAVLAALAQSPNHSSPDFVTYLMQIRLLLAPAYARQAVENAPGVINAFLKDASRLDDDPAAFALFDWQLHHLLTQQASNPVFRLLLNSFEQIYALMGEPYFNCEACRRHSRSFYAVFQDCLDDPAAAETLTHKTMQESLDLWNDLQGGAS